MAAINLIRIDELSSTNDYLKTLIAEKYLPEGTVVITSNQVNGRGQGANTWETKKDKNLTFSLLLHPTFINASDMFLISKVISLGIVDYLNSITSGFKIKWPNDIYWKDKKICGILIENQLLGSCLNFSIIGIGLNINQKEFKSNAPNPISLYNILKREFNLETSLENLLTNIERWYGKLYDHLNFEINAAYFDNLYRNEGYFNYKANNKIFTAKIVSVDNDGLLQLETTQGTLQSFYFKEVEFVM